jgi:hypothetical protein
MGKNKFSYYFTNYLRLLIPHICYKGAFERVLNGMSDNDQEAILKRVNYYNKLLPGSTLDNTASRIDQFKYRSKLKTYFFDLVKYLRYFQGDCRFHYRFGDVTEVPLVPAFVKSRPVGTNNRNSVLLKLNEVRHFNFVNDNVPFKKKKNILFGRAKVFALHKNRELFLEKYYNHPLCDTGKINNDGRNSQWLVPKASIRQHLNYKFILCLEGNDVATNLKWVMSSNSLAVMPAPRYETWFMEGTLIPDYHYVSIADDYSDLEEKLTYYTNHQDEALKIIENAHRYVKQFLDKKQEKLISLLTIQQYFNRTMQNC